MAHINKVKASAVGQMVAHNRRLREPGHYGNERIDSERTHLNYRIGGVPEVAPVYADVVAATPRGKLRKNQVGMIVIANTLPKDWPQDRDPREYFAMCHEYNKSILPTAVELGMDVHMDETTPHGHDAFLPTTADGRFNFDEVCPRKTYKNYHRDLQKYIEQQTGLHVAVLLADDDPDKALAGVKRDRLDAAKRAVTAEIAQATREEQGKLIMTQLDRADAADELAATRAQIERAREELERTKAQVDAANQRLERLRAAGDVKERRVASLTKQVDETNAQIERVDGEIAHTKSQVTELRGRIDKLKADIGRVLRQLTGNVPQWVTSAVAAVLRPLGVAWQQSERGWAALQVAGSARPVTVGRPVHAAKYGDVPAGPARLGDVISGLRYGERTGYGNDYAHVR